MNICFLRCALLSLYSLLLCIIKKIRSSIEENCVPMNDCRSWSDVVKVTSNHPSKEIHRFELTQTDGESLFIEMIDDVTHLECHVILSHQGTNYKSERFIAPRTADPMCFKCGPLFIDIREPFRCYRIVFRGEMSDDVGTLHFVAICGWFKPTSDARFFFSNVQPKAFLTYFLKNPFSVIGNICKFESVRSRNDILQWGQLHCEVTVGKDTVTKRYRGSKQRISYADTGREDTISVYLQNGDRLFWKSYDATEHTFNMSHGILTRANHRVRSIIIESPEYVYEAEQPGLVNFETNRYEQFHLTKREVHSKMSFTRADGTVVEIFRVNVSHLDEEGLAFITRTKASLEYVPEVAIEPGVQRDICAPEVHRSSPILPLFHIASCDSSLTGGKGSNLAILAMNRKNFNVPRGIVVTTSAYSRHLMENPKLKSLIEEIGHNGLSLQECLSIGEQIELELSKTKLSKDILDSIRMFLDLETGSSPLAVRSSAVGEDGADFSSAGQLETFLNIEPIDVEEKVRQCWASNFRTEVVTYRRTNGQLLNPLMAVVIQSMVNNATAGVMFTCDPVRRDPSRMVINAVIGMGQDIVSGAVTPDTIVVTKRGEVIEKPRKCCIDEQLLSQLMSIGEFLEEFFGRPQDIEFLVKNKQIHLVQSRDVTGLNRETEFELLTEFDTPTLTEAELFTTANVGEVMPRPQTPLGITIVVRLIEKGANKNIVRFIDRVTPRHVASAFNITRQKVFLNLGEIFFRQWQMIEKDPISEYVLGGERMMTPEMYELAKRRYDPVPAWFPIFRLGSMVYSMLWGSTRCLNNAKRCSAAIERLEKDIDIRTLITVAEQQMDILLEIIDNHTSCSSCSSFTYILVAMIIRQSAEGDLTPEMFSDIATICGNNSSEVISADIPISLKRIARAIAQSPIRLEFELLEGDAALRLLEGNEVIAKLVEEFFVKHGHRGPFELEINAKGWQEQPELLITTLKTMLSDPNLLAVVETNTEVDVFDSLKYKPKGIAKLLMRYMVKQCHRGIAIREEAKNHLIKGCCSLRKTFRQLGDKLEKEGVLPYSDLLYFLTISEIKQLVNNKSLRLLSRAYRRRAIYDEHFGLQYKSIYWGNVEPLDTSAYSSFQTIEKLLGVTVCEGKVVAPARVARTLEEAKLTKPGEILITRFTDICWSPFFPIIKGIVTEIGGLLSHGAVVAREYGLPSLIAVKHATDVFQTGDLVELDANNGTISKVQKEETEGN